MRSRLLLAAAVLLTACGPDIDLRKDIELVDVSTGWYDTGVGDDGMNKIVPTVSLRIKNRSTEEVDRLQVNAIFRRVGETQSWGERFVAVVGNNGLPVGATSKPILLRSERGYTSTAANAQMLQNREFVDAKVDIFGRTGSRWIKMGEFQIERALVRN